MCNLKEIKASVNAIKNYNKKLSILHCVSNLSNRIAEINLGAIDTLKNLFAKLKLVFQITL